MPLTMKTRNAGLGADAPKDPCELPGAWIVVQALDGKYYNTCFATGEKQEVDVGPGEVDSYLRVMSGDPGGSDQIIDGIDNMVLFGGVAAAGLLLMVMMRR